MAGSAPSRALTIAGRALPVTIARHRLARRYVVRVGSDGGVRLTVPRGASLAGAFAFAQRQADWIIREMERQRVRQAPWVTGSRAWFRGELSELRVSDSAVSLGTEIVPLARPDADVRAAVEAHLRAMAVTELPERCRALARESHVSFTTVTVRNQKSRWGACSPSRAITLNWRLIQMPARVSDYVILHELSHVRHPNHSRRFWHDLERVCAWWKDAERWLRRHGRELLP